MAVSNKIGSVQERNFKCERVDFDLNKCALKLCILVGTTILEPKDIKFRSKQR